MTKANIAVVSAETTAILTAVGKGKREKPRIPTMFAIMKPIQTFRPIGMVFFSCKNSYANKAKNPSAALPRRYILTPFQSRAFGQRY